MPLCTSSRFPKGQISAASINWEQIHEVPRGITTQRGYPGLKGGVKQEDHGSINATGVQVTSVNVSVEP